MAAVSLKGIKKICGNKVTAVHDFNLEIADKAFIVLVGPSGCGKSTTLWMVAGLEEIHRRGRDVVLRVPTTELTGGHRSGFAYGGQVHFTFRGDLIHLFDPETEKNLLPLAGSFARPAECADGII